MHIGFRTLNIIRVSFTVHDKTFEGNARIVDKHTESKLAAEISNLMDRKYRWNEGLIDCRANTNFLEI